MTSSILAMLKIWAVLQVVSTCSDQRPVKPTTVSQHDQGSQHWTDQRRMPAISNRRNMLQVKLLLTTRPGNHDNSDTKPLRSPAWMENGQQAKQAAVAS